MFRGQIQRASLGRLAKIGAFYDIRTDNLLPYNLFGSKVDSIAPFTMDIGDTSTKLVTSDSLQDKFNGLEVEAELQVSVLSGLVELSGSGAYLKEERQSARGKSMSLLYKMKTVNEVVNINRHKDTIDMEALKQATNATHVVTGIGWGAVCSITCEYQNKEDDDVHTVEGSIREELDKLKKSVDVKDASIPADDDQDSKNHKRFTFKCETDVSALDKDPLVTFHGAVELARSLPRLVEDMNDGKGAPLMFMLRPLDEVVRGCNLQSKVQVQHEAIGDNIVKKCMLVVDGMTKKRQVLYDLLHDLRVYSNYVAQGDLTRINNLCRKHAHKESNFRDFLRALVTNVRSGRKQVSFLEDFLSEEQQRINSDATDHEEINTFQKDIDRISFVESMINRKIVYLGKHDKFIVNDKMNVYVFYKSGNEYDKKNSERNQHFFLRLKATHCNNERGYKFMIVDEEIRKDLWPATQNNASIHLFVNGYQQSEDLLTKEGQDTEMCLIKIDQPTKQKRRPSKRTFVELRCPNTLSGYGQCAVNPTTWLCSKCKESVEYGIETKYFYCKCGESDPKRSVFRCNEVDHGTAFKKFPENNLKHELSHHKALKEMNILILGETGVGKSTWINGFQNYLNFANLEEATIAEELPVLISSEFTFTQEGVPRQISLEGKNDNEILEAGKSATKQTHSYVFRVDEYRVCLIDTPGIGTSDGIERDRENLENILSYLTYYDDIHAVCILLKSNNARVTPTFNFCIQELLANLHSSAKHNIVFCFTNARGTFYQPGDTLPALNKLLTDRNVGIDTKPPHLFCFDNEPFRFLACLKNGLEFNEKDKQAYTESWDRCVAETRRLLEHIKGLTPHKVRNTVSLIEARRIIVVMSRPLPEVAQTIQLNLMQSEEVKRQIEEYDKDMEGLKEKLRFSGFNLKITQLERPRTVCTHPTCVRYVSVGEKGVENKVYDQICHENCTLGGISPETPNSFRLLGCRCLLFHFRSCRKCGHSHKYHMHITYNTETVKTEFLSQEVQADIKEKKNEKDTREAILREIDKKRTELMDEEKFIMKTSAKYGSFLKANALIPYNDAVGDYLDICIEQETHKAEEYRNDAFLKRLQEMKLQYTNDRAALNDAIRNNSSESINTPEEVMKLQEELLGLKHMGETLRNSFHAISMSQSADNITHPETTATIQQPASRKDTYEPGWNLPKKLNKLKGRLKLLFSDFVQNQVGSHGDLSTNSSPGSSTSNPRDMTS